MDIFNFLHHHDRSNVQLIKRYTDRRPRAGRVCARYCVGCGPTTRVADSEVRGDAGQGRRGARAKLENRIAIQQAMDALSASLKAKNAWDSLINIKTISSRLVKQNRCVSSDASAPSITLKTQVPIFRRRLPVRWYVPENPGDARMTLDRKRRQNGRAPLSLFACLFDRHALCQIAGFVYVDAPLHRAVVREELRGYDRQHRHEQRIGLGQLHP